MTPLDKLADIAPLFVLFPIFYMSFRAFLEYKTRLKLIEKDMVGDEVKNLFRTNPDRFLPSSLKWGLVLTLVGVAAVVVNVIEYVSAETAFGVMLIAAGAGLLAYYFIGTLKAKEMNDDK